VNVRRAATIVAMLSTAVLATAFQCNQDGPGKEDNKPDNQFVTPSPQPSAGLQTGRQPASPK